MSIIIPTIHTLNQSLARDSLPHFIRQAWPIIEPSVPLIWSWHLDVICDALTSMTNNTLKRLIINIPPGFGKSLIISVLWPTWEWVRDDSLRILTFSYGQHLTVRDNKSARDIIQSRWYRNNFNVKLAGDQNVKIKFSTDRGKGWRIASSVGGEGTGQHPDRIIMDDLVKAAKAGELSTGQTLADVNEWISNTVMTRLARDPAIVNVMQRLSLKDATAYLESMGGWAKIMFPMRYSKDYYNNLTEADKECSREYDYRHPEHKRYVDLGSGQKHLLCPDMMPEERVATAEKILGPYHEPSQFGQQPVAKGGTHFKRVWFVIIDVAPISDISNPIWWVRGWDVAATADGGDWTVGVKLGVDSKGIIYIAHAVRLRGEPDEVNETILSTAETDGAEVHIREEREGGSSGKTVTAARLKALAGYDYGDVPVSGKGDKIARATAFRAQAPSNVRMVRGPWNGAYLDVMCSFPYGINDDDVDATSCGYNAFIVAKPPKELRTKVMLGNRDRDGADRDRDSNRGHTRQGRRDRGRERDRFGLKP